MQNIGPQMVTIPVRRLNKKVILHGFGRKRNKNFFRPTERRE
jgi:hypothetical protein